MVPPSNTISVPADGSVYLDGILLPGLLHQLAAPFTYCRLLYHDGQACDFVYLYANPAFERGMGAGRVIGRRTSEVFPHIAPAKRSVMRAYERVVRTGTPETSEHFSDAIRKWVTLHIVRPQPDHFCVVFTDIRDRVPGDRLRSTFDAMAEGFYVRDRNGDVLDHNAAAEQILGMDSAKMRERNRPPIARRAFRIDGSIYPECDWPSRRTLVTGKALRGEVMGIEFADGSLKWLSLNTQPIGVDIGRPDYVVTTFVDISERVKAEQQRLNTLESIGDGYLAIDADWRFRYVNSAAERLLRTSRDSLIGKVHWDLYPHTLGTAIETHYREAAAGQPTAFEYENVNNKRCLSLRCFPRESGGIEVFFTEETETRRAREALRQSNADLRRLVSQMNTVEAEERLRIAREIHDDLQQSLAAVRLELGAILKLTKGAESEIGDLARVASRHLGEVIESTRRIVRDLRPPELDAIGLSAALEGMLDRTRSLTGLKAEMHPPCAPGAQTAIPSEIAYCLYRIAQEALNNVHKHAGASAVEVSLDCSTEDGARLLVRDNGRGFGPNDLRRDDSFGVLGMQERVMALGGTLSIEPVTSGGTLVTATIPFCR